jgi:hypothetical protein
MEILPPFDWGPEWPQGEYLIQSDAGDMLHPPGFAQGQEVISFESEPERPQYPGSSGDMVFRDVLTQGTSCISAMREDYAPEEQGGPSSSAHLTALFNMSESEPQGFTFERPWEGLDLPLPMGLCPIPNRIELDSTMARHEHFPLFDTCSGNVEYQQSSPWLQRLMDYHNTRVLSHDLPKTSE